MAAPTSYSYIFSRTFVLTSVTTYAVGSSPAFGSPAGAM